MPWNTFLPILIWAVVSIPLAIWLWYRLADSKLTALLIILDYVLFNIYCFLSISWSIVDLYLEFIPLLLSLLILLRLTGTRQWRKGPFLPKKSFLPILIAVGLSMALVVEGYFEYRVFRALSFPSDNQVLLYFPVRNGLYVIANGGNGLNGMGLNDSYQDWLGKKVSDNPSVAFSADIFKIETKGWISSGILPPYYGDYSIYDDIVTVPCPGTVLEVEDGHPDVLAYTRTTTDLGNYVTIECSGGFEVTLSNLKSRSILIKPKQPVRIGLEIGLVGNSASNSIPHLHVQATKKDSSQYGTPAPILFDGAFAVDQFPIRNKIYLP
jgi:hypothetical protein